MRAHGATFNTELGGSMYRAFMLSVSVVAMSWAGSAAADSPKLKGSYGFTGTAACLVAPGNSGLNPGNDPPGPPGFNAHLQPLNQGSSFSRSFSVEGIRTFNGNGTGTVKGTAVGITVRPTPGPPPAIPAFPPSAGSADFSFSFTYTVDGNGGWTATMVPGSYTETFTAGPRTGQTATVDAIPPVVGMISEDGKTLIAAHVTPDVEVHTYSNGDVWPEICHRSRLFIKLRNDNDD
jgi:hypothetical protein